MMHLTLDDRIPIRMVGVDTVAERREWEHATSGRKVSGEGTTPRPDFGRGVAD
jgi:hypothetical protein